VSRVREGNFAFLMEETTNDYINSRQPCDTMRVGEAINDRGYGIATPLQSPLNYYLNLAVLHLQETGEIEQLRQKWWVDNAECKVSKRELVKPKEGQLYTGSICGLFAIVIVLLLAAIVIAVIELVLKSKCDAKQNNTTVYQAIKNNVTGTCGKKKDDSKKCCEDGKADSSKDEDKKVTDQEDSKKTEAA
jgi:hypothetical protein